MEKRSYYAQLLQLKMKLKERIFLEAFTGKGRFRNLLEGIPVWVILNSEAALAGAAIHAAAIHALEVEHR